MPPPTAGSASCFCREQRRAQRFADPHACRWPLAAQFCMIMPKAAGNLSGAIEGKGLTGKMKVEIAAP